MIMAVGMGLTMAPATDSVMGSLPLGKAGVGSAVNDTTRQVGGALGVAIIGSVMSSIYGSKVADWFDGVAEPGPGRERGQFGAAKEAAKSQIGAALQVAAAAAPSRSALAEQLTDDGERGLRDRDALRRRRRGRRHRARRGDRVRLAARATRARRRRRAGARVRRGDGGRAARRGRVLEPVE